MMTQAEREEFELARMAIAASRDSAQKECDDLHSEIDSCNKHIAACQHKLEVSTARMLAYAASLQALQNVIVHEPSDAAIVHGAD